MNKESKDLADKIADKGIIDEIIDMEGGKRLCKDLNLFKNYLVFITD